MRNQNAQDDIDLAALGRAARKSLPRVALYALLAGGATAGVMSTMLPRYASTATIEIAPRVIVDPNNPNASLDPQVVRETTDKEAVNTHVRKILSTDLAQRMSKDFNLAERPEFNERLPANDTFTRVLQMAGLVSAKPSQTDEDRVLSAYNRAMRVAQIRDSRNIQIEFTTSDPNFSAEGANKLASLYRESLDASRKDENREAVPKLEIEVARLTREVATADKSVVEGRNKTGTIRTGGSGGDVSLNERQLGDLTSELSKASGARSEADARANAAKEQMARGTAESNPDVQKSQIIPRLSEQRVRLERQVSELSASLLPAHPRMKQVNGDLASLKRQINDEVRKVVDGLIKDASIAAERERTIQASIDAVKRTVVSAASDDVQLKALEDTAKAKRNELDRQQRALNAARTNVETGGSPVEARIVQRALPINEKVWPKPGMFGPLVALAMFLVGLAWSVTRAIVAGPNGSQSGTPDRGRRDGFPLDAEPVPTAASIVAQPKLAAVAAPIAAVAVATADSVADTGDGETASTIGAALAARDEQSACRTLVTGDRPDIDAATEAIMLAKAISSAGKSVVLVDWANGGSELSDHTGGVAAPGIAQLIQGDASFEDVLQKLADTDAHFVPAGDALSEPSLVFDADRANLVLDALDESYNHIIVYGSHQSAHALFEATQGRFDVGVTVSEGDAVANGAGSSYLGFEVAGMTIYRIDRKPAPAIGKRRNFAQRITRAEARA